MGFSIIFRILKLLGALPMVFSSNNGDRIAEIIYKIKSLARNDDLDSILIRLERDDKFRGRLTNKLAKLYEENAKYKMVSRDMINARKRDMKLRKKSGNIRSDLILLFAILGIIGPILLIIYMRNSISNEITLIFASIISLCSSIVNDASMFEFGNNIARIKGRN